MTETRTESLPANPVGQALGQAVGQAQTVLTRVLTGVLAKTGTPRETYLALLRLSVHGDTLQRDRYVRDLSDSLGLDLWAAGELADGMLDAGLLALAGETIRLADAGAELRERTRRSVGAVTAPLYEGLDPADMETTVRILQDITSRAREL